MANWARTLEERLFGGRSQDEVVFLLFSVIISVVTGVYGFLNYKFGIPMPYVILQVSCAAFIAVNGLAYQMHRNTKLASLLLAVSAAAVLLTSVIHGGVGGSGIYWAFGFPAAAFLFLGIRLGHMVNSFFLLGIVIIAVLERYDYLETYYDGNQLRETVIVMVFLTLLAVISQYARERLQSQLERQKEKLQIILGQLPAGVVMADMPAGTISIANQAAGRLLGQDFEIGMTIEECVKLHNIQKVGGEPYPTQEMPLYLAMIKGEKSEVGDMIAFRPDGTRVALSCSAAPIFDAKGRIVAAVAVFVDMTKEFNLNQMKSELVSLVSHQLKTPLTSLQWTVETLTSGDLGEVSDEQAEALGTMTEILQRLKVLVADMLNVSRIETGRKFEIVSHPTDMATLVRSVIAEHSEAARRRGIEVDHSALPDSLVMEVDEAKMREVFGNLIGNAVKYSRDGGRVEVGRTGEQGNGHHTIYVRDDGIGIPKDIQAHIFERFFRAPNVPEGTEGTGLGLYIAKAIVEKQGGSIWFESEEGKGTTFYVRLKI